MLSQNCTDCCPTGNKVIFQLPMDSCNLGHKQRAHFNFSSDGVGDVSREEPGQLLSPTAEDYPGAMPRSSFCRDLREELKLDVNTSSNKLEPLSDGCSLQNLFLTPKASQAKPMVKQCLQSCFDNLHLPVKLLETASLVTYSSSYISSLRPIHQQFFLKDLDNLNASPSSSYSSVRSCSDTRSCLFSNLETAVYMTLYDDCCPIRTFGTQATASINKCLQVTTCRYTPSFETKSDLFSATTMSTQSKGAVLRNAEVYFFGRKKNEPKSGMGGSGSKVRLHKNANALASPVRSEKNTAQVQAVQCKKTNSTVSAQTNKTRGTSAATSTAKAVCIQGPCPATGTKGDILATVSHIRIGPSQLCPYYGSGPCQGPKCIIASADNEQNAPVKVTHATNPRRGVFEIVIRRMTGTPLAKNELMLEWTPPPVRTTPCGIPCPSACTHLGPCSPSRCKLIVRASPCKPRCSKKPCKKPCGPSPYCGTPCPSPCRTSPCSPRPCGSAPCGPSRCRPAPCRSPAPCKRSCKPCRICKPCKPCRRCQPPVRCKARCAASRCFKPCTSPRPCPSRPQCCGPCPPPSCAPPPCKSTCALPCCSSPCNTPCKSSPCLRLCPVGRRKRRRARSQPRMKRHKNRISPCLNRSDCCPVVRCRSVPGVDCCGRTRCAPRKCCSVFPYKPTCCKSSCYTCGKA